jgi:glycolate oxidase iron-sulfur subunit
MAPPPGSRLRAYHRVALQLDRPREARATAPGNEEVESDLALFVGCVAQAAQPGLATAACRVLGRLGYPVQVPGNQRCCGAMHRHGGFPDDAEKLAAHNATVFANHRILATASACAAELSAQQDLDRTEEICRFLTGLDWPQDAQLRPLPARVAVHEPCSHRNILRDGNAAYDLLRRIPDIEVVALEDNAFCCGAAGTYLLDNPTLSATLLAPKIEHLKGLNTKILVTTNTGCSLHLAAGAREAGLELEVLHPVELIERQLMETAAE